MGKNYPVIAVILSIILLLPSLLLDAQEGAHDVFNVSGSISDTAWMNVRDVSGDGLKTLAECDVDNDGFKSSNSSCGGTDCDDNNASINPNAAEILDNFVDEDCDGWINTSLNYSLRSHHPRVLITVDELKSAINRMYGDNATDPYKTWFDRVKQRELAAQQSGSLTPSMVDLALIYKATGNTTFLDWYKTRLQEYLLSRYPPGDGSAPTYECLVSMDMLWDEINDAQKLMVYELSSPYNAFNYASGANRDEISFDYHGAAGRDRAFMFAAMYAYDPIMTHPDVINDPTTYSFNTSLYVKAMVEEMHPGGQFYGVENRIAGDTTYNDAIPGDYGGMYDNFGYDTSEESHSIYLISEFQTATDQQIIENFLHDKYRGRYYQYFGVPHRTGYYGSGDNSYQVTSMARIWFTRTDSSGPSRTATALTANKYHDPYMQYYADRWRKAFNVYNYDYYITILWWWLLFYDNNLSITYPENNTVKARYFNGPGLVSMRSDWTDNATFAVFVSGEGISRRYDDANSFIIHRKQTLVPHAGARIRFQEDNTKHHWYTIESLSKNTLKIFDPDESFDINSSGQRIPYHTGTPLYPSDNMGGQISEVGAAGFDGDYSHSGEPHYCGGFDLGVCEVANIIKYGHKEDEYVYVVGDATPSYTEKIDYFDREFIYLTPDIFIILDRVKSVNESFKKVWVMHTIEQPDSAETVVEQDNGMYAFSNATDIFMNGTDTVIYLKTLLPGENRVVVRGGDTLLISGNPLRQGVDIIEPQIIDSDIPRWVELFAIGPDYIGNVTLYGDALEGNDTTEVIGFDGRMQTYVGSYYTHISSGILEDTSQSWHDDEWVGYYLRLRGSSVNERVVITGNNRTTLFVDGGFDTSGVWGYGIERPVANSYLHWKNIKSITTEDMDVDNFIVSTPHYFDAEDAYGKLYSFAPHTDMVDDNYNKNRDLGQWTLNIEATAPRQHDNFLTVLYLTDPDKPDISCESIEAQDYTGAYLNGSYVVLFSKYQNNLSYLSYSINASGLVKHLIVDLCENTVYYVYDNLVLNQTLNSSDQGTLFFNTTSGGEHVYHVTTTAQTFVYKADTNQDGLINMPEFISFIARWKTGDGVTRQEVEEARDIWFLGGNYSG